MIENAHQLNITRFWLKQFKRAAVEIKNDPDISSWHQDILLRSYQAMIDELQADIDVFLINNPDKDSSTDN